MHSGWGKAMHGAEIKKNTSSLLTRIQKEIDSEDEPANGRSTQETGANNNTLCAEILSTRKSQ